MDPITLENALEKKCKKHLWLLWIFFLTSSPGILNSMHISSYIFLGGDPSFFCSVPELLKSNWTNEQIKEISNPRMKRKSCEMYAWNYTLLSEMTFQEAIIYFNRTKKPEVNKCKNYIYDEKVPHETIVSQWDLVCDDLPLRSTAQAAIALGKLAGAFIFGIFSDRFGRKKTFVLSSLLYIAVGPIGAFMNDYMVFIILRILVGAASSGVFEGGFTILSELTVKNYRAYLLCLFTVSYAIGLILLPLAAYFTNNWRQLQLAISLPTLFLLIHCWFLPESPRWLMIRGKLKKASALIGVEYERGSGVDVYLQQTSNKVKSYHGSRKICVFLKSYFSLFSTPELIKRILICYFEWFVANLCYYAIALNAINFTVNEYLYVGLNGIVEVPAYLIPLPLLAYFGRKSIAIALFSVSGITLLSVMFIPQGWPVMIMAMVGRLSVAAVFAIITIQTSELFPTEHRNSAVGSSITIAQFGAMAAPYIVDLFGKIEWWIPTTLCGSLAILGAFFMFFIPETRNVPMLDTLEDMNNQQNESNTQVKNSAN